MNEVINLRNTVGKKKRNKGFTLIELIVVIGILLVLAVLAAVAMTGLADQAQQAARRSDATTVAQQLNLYNSLVTNAGDRITNIATARTTAEEPRITGGAAVGEGVATDTVNFNLRVVTTLPDPHTPATDVRRAGLIDMDLSTTITAARFTELTGPDGIRLFWDPTALMWTVLG